MTSVARVLHQGLAADKPTADATLNQGWIYYETDTGTLRQSWNGSWVAINATAGSSQIAEIIVGAGGQATIAFASIPGTYRSLRIIGQGRISYVGSGQDIGMQFNGDTAANYETEGFYGYGAGNGSLSFLNAGATTLSVGHFPGTTAPADSADMFEIMVPNYAATVFHKNMSSRWSMNVSAAGNDHIILEGVGWWNSTAAITDIVLKPASGNFIEGTTVTLYGIT